MNAPIRPAMTASDTITILTTTGYGKATKQFALKDGSLVSIPYAMERFFNFSEHHVDGLLMLSKVLMDLEQDVRSFVIRGQKKPECTATPLLRKSNGQGATFNSASRRWLCVDLDDLPVPDNLSDFNANAEKLVRYARSKLPPQFHHAACHWQFSSSMGMKPGLRLHLWFWLERPVSDNEAKAWFWDAETKVDYSLFQAVQPHYTAAPLFGEGVPNPVSVRSGLLLEEKLAVEVPADFPTPTRVPRQRRPRSSGGEGHLYPPEIEFDENDLAVNGRERLLYLKSIEATAQLTRGTSKTPTIEAIANLTWSLFEQDANLLDGRWTKSDAHEKAAARYAEVLDGRQFNSRHHSTVLYPEVEPYFPISPLPRAVGQQHLEETLAEFFESFERGDNPAMALRITMGSGKTTSMLEELESLYQRRPDLNVAIYTPRHDLAAEIIAKFQRPHELLDIRQIQGMTDREGTDASLCIRPAYVHALVKNGISVRPNACARNEQDRCAHYDVCPYWAQFRTAPLSVGSLRVYSHANLKFPRQETEPEPDLVVIDESFLSTMLAEHRLPLEAFRYGFFDSEGSYVSERAATAIRNREPLLSQLRVLGVDGAWLAGLNFRAQSSITFDGNSNSPMIPHANALPAMVAAKEALRAVLIEELGVEGRTDAVRVRFDPNSAEIVVNVMHALPFSDTTPLLLLDATADELVVPELLGTGRKVDFRRIDIEQRAYVTQVYDRVGTNSFWSDDLSGSGEHLEDLVRVLNEQSRAGLKVLCVSNKALADRLRVEVSDPHVAIDHFGNLRGADNYKDHDVVFITGRNQPPQSAIDGMARAIWWNAQPSLQHDEAAVIGVGSKVSLPWEKRGYTTANPEDAAGVDVRSFSDDRIEAVHSQIREAETVQALARLRLVHTQRPKHVYLLSNLPIEIPVDRLIGWNELMPDWSERHLVEYGNIPLTATGLIKMLPDQFPTFSRARDAIRRSKLEDPSSLFLASPALSRVSAVVVEFKVLRNGLPSGRAIHHLFRINPAVPDAIMVVGQMDFAAWKRTLEEGYPANEGTGWGPVELLNYDFVGVR